MAQHFIGYYHIRNHGHLVIIRKMTLAGDGNELTVLALQGQKDPRYIQLEDPEVGVIVGEEAEATYEMGFQLSAGHTYHESLDMSGMHFPGMCSECKGPLKQYLDMLTAGEFRCPHCKRLFMNVRSNPLNDIACGLALDNVKLDGKVLITPPFELPFGFPPPNAFPAGASITPDMLLKVTEHENLDKSLAPYAATLDN